jgi:hypothetical protein
LENYGLQSLLRGADVTGLSLTPTFVKETTKFRIIAVDKDSAIVSIKY